ncbi:AsmA family protein [Shewanella gaetbuli]
MKLIKWLVFVVVALGVSLFAYLTLFFNINDFKPQIVEQVKEQTGRDLAINQDLSWSFFPSFGINIGEVTFSNPQGFDPVNMLEIKQAVANVALIPLFSQQVEIEQLSLDGLKLNLVTNKQGVTSFSGLDSTSDKATQSDPTTEDTSHSANLSSLKIAGIEITNLQINVIDEQVNSNQTFNLTSFTLDSFSLGEFSNIAYEFDAQLPDMKVSSSGEGKIKVSNELNIIELIDLDIENLAEGDSLPNKAIKSSLTLGANAVLDTKDVKIAIKDLKVDSIEALAMLDVNYANTIPIIKVMVEFGDIDLDTLLPKNEQQTDSEQASSSPEPTTEPDLSALKQIDLSVDLKAKSIKVNNLLTQNWQMNATVRNGIVNLEQLKADLYEGNILVTAKLDGRNKTPSYQFAKTLTGVQIRPLLTDLAEVDLISGNANLKINGSGKSLIPSKLKQQLLAKGNFEVADGSLYGVNIPQMIRSAEKKLQGDLSATDDSELKTDFTSLTGHFDISKGVVSNPDLSMASPLIRLDGKGTANIISEAIDYQLITKVVGSLAGQGGESGDLSGVDIPLKISGTFKEPKYGIDTDALMQGQLKKQTDEAKDKLKDSLFKKLGL